MGYVQLLSEERQRITATKLGMRMVQIKPRLKITLKGYVITSGTLDSWSPLFFL